MNCDSCEDPKKAWITALTVRAFTRSSSEVFSGSVLLELARRGTSREQAYEWVQRNAMRSFHEQTDFKQLLLADSDVTSVLPPAEIERAFDLNEQFRYVDHVFHRVFGEDASTGGGIPAAVQVKV